MPRRRIDTIPAAPYTFCMVRSNVIAALLLVVSAFFSIMGALSRGDNALSPDRQKAPGSAQVAAPAATSEPQALARNAQLLSTVDAPGRDLVAITQRLKLHSNTNIPSVVNAVAPNYAVGTQHQFYLADMVNNDYYTIKATIREVTAHAYWYVKDGYTVDTPALKASAAYFDDQVYPTDRRVFGSEPSPGVDNDPRITVLLAPMAAVDGYFSSSDTFSKLVNPFSNEREMIYIGSQPQENPADSRNDFMGTLAHEFQHMIDWNVHRDRDVWLDEGCSEVAMYVNGYASDGFDFAFTDQPDVQLNAWGGEPGKSSAHYGASYLFLRYLMDRYGGETFISSIVKQHGLGIGAIDGAVKQAGNPAGFEGAFKDWLIANSLNNADIAGGRYSYAEGGRARQADELKSYPAKYDGTVHQYAADYIKLSGNTGRAIITFQGSPSVKVLAADPHSGQGYWYSNRRDSGDATLTRELDLTKVSKATLQFWAWYDIENAFDYAYIEVSDDGGKNWTPQEGKYTTTTNPNGTSFGQAWTGKSGVSASPDSAPEWVQESVDLSRYAGKKVQIRFEYVTDEGYNAPGLAIDDLRVPEIGYSDNAEADNGWNVQGFVRIGNSLPEKWYVALIENATPPTVREMTVDAAGAGTLTIEGLGAGKPTRDATLVIAPMAPKTTETSGYSVTVKK